MNFATNDSHQMLASHSSTPEKEKLATTACDGAEKNYNFTRISWFSEFLIVDAFLGQQQHRESTLNSTWTEATCICLHLPPVLRWSLDCTNTPGFSKGCGTGLEEWESLRIIHWKSVDSSFDLGCFTTKTLQYFLRNQETTSTYSTQAPLEPRTGLWVWFCSLKCFLAKPIWSGQCHLDSKIINLGPKIIWNFLLIRWFTLPLRTSLLHPKRGLGKSLSRLFLPSPLIEKSLTQHS